MKGIDAPRQMLDTVNTTMLDTIDPGNRNKFVFFPLAMSYEFILTEMSEIEIETGHRIVYSPRLDSFFVPLPSTTEK